MQFFNRGLPIMQSGSMASKLLHHIPTHENHEKTHSHLLPTSALTRHVTTVDCHWMHVIVTLIDLTVGHLCTGLYSMCTRIIFSLSASTLCITKVTFTSHLIKSLCYGTGCGQCCPRQTGPGAESGVTPRGNQLPQEAAR